WQQQLANGASLAGMRTVFAGSSIAAANISALFQQVLGYPAGSADISFWQQQLANGASFAAMRTLFADSSFAATAISALFQQVLGYPAGSGDIVFWQQQLANGASLAAMRTLFAGSSMAAAAISALFQQVLGRPAGSGDIAFWEQQLANGASLAGMRTLFAGSSIKVASLTAAPQNPLIIDTVAGQGITDHSTDQPFAAVAVSDPQASEPDTATITLTNASGTATDANGVLSGTGLTEIGAGTGIYTLTSGTPAGLTAALNAVVFTPTPGQMPVGQSVTTNLRLAVHDASGTGTDGTTSITAQAVGTPTHPNFICGSIGSDTFIGTASTPTASPYVFGENLNPSGNDVISGFNVSQDIVQLSAAQFAGFAAVQAVLTSSGGNAVLHFDSSDSVTLQGVNPASLHACNFTFV
ncbi:MAG: hypothetical protein ACHQIO_19455, partial [Nevskiales bacterium]